MFISPIKETEHGDEMKLSTTAILAVTLKLAALVLVVAPHVGTGRRELPTTTTAAHAAACE